MLKMFLEDVYRSYHRPEHLMSDPLEFVHRFEDPWDQEVVALVSAQLAYGNVRQIRASVEAWIQTVTAVSGSPARFVRQGLHRAEARRALETFRHRIHTGADLLSFMDLIGQSWRQHGSVGAHFLRGLHSEDQNFSGALDRFLADWKSWATVPRGGVLPRSLGHFLAAPSSGSCCKRWCMVLRWMGRKDELDPGLWRRGSALIRELGPASAPELRPSQLVLPLDTHVGQISQFLGLTERKTLNWRAAVEITRRLGDFDPTDPVKYDFALARLGILDRCRKRFVPEVCASCELRGGCRHALQKRPEF
ncbi:MAG: hypothetical protein RJB38_1895 [Pseudomonadota bacterium]|jgi:uncharacterized protein (TIGR02757 family)